ncbi:phosphatase PAP2 family protein [Bacillus sp. B190/17]|uniref:Phosphatase PAP2 family protein n=1 Tax=Bacillus lumedeiriae TaxID=3058829 RepID=A0ABW8IAA9_9BACI
MDTKLFHYINDLAGHNTFLDHMMIAFSKWGIYIFILLIFFSIFNKKQRPLGLYGVASLAAALIISRILKYTINRDRPFITEDAHLLFAKSPSPSFPSDQGVICGVFAALFWIISPKWRWLAVTLAFLVAVSRVYVGHHYPSDVAAGLVIGILCFLMIRKIRLRTKDS